MKTLTLTTFLFVSILATSATLAAEPAKPPAFGADLGARPIGVEANEWIPISDTLGFVVVSTQADPIRYEGPPPGERTRPLLRGVMPPAPATGYFMVKTTDGWRRLVVMSPADLAAVKG